MKIKPKKDNKKQKGKEKFNPHHKKSIRLANRYR